MARKTKKAVKVEAEEAEPLNEFEKELARLDELDAQAAKVEAAPAVEAEPVVESAPVAEVEPVVEPAKPEEAVVARRVRNRAAEPEHAGEPAKTHADEQHQY
jgi:hypothetical protein